MKHILFALILLIASWAAAQTQDVLGVHDLSSGVNNVKGSMSAACLYCHAPHSGIGKGPLWAQTLSTQTYSLYSSDTFQNSPSQPTLGESSSLCLSCHDGTVAPGLVVPYGQLNVSGNMTNLVGTHLENSHPFSLQLPLKDAASLVEGFAATGTTTDPTHSVKLIKGNIECTSCHNPHVQKTDMRSPTFLVRDNANGQLCLACHTTKPRTVNSHNNPLESWTTSIHATSGTQVNPAAELGGYSTVAEFACQSCHVSHNAAGSYGLLRNPVPPKTNIDTTSQNCITCHSNDSNLSVPAPDVFSEFNKKGHPFSAGTNIHQSSESVVLDQNRHATCADCHNAHAAKQVLTFDAAPKIRPSQNGVAGVALDGSVLTGPAVNQYENCLRCHGASSGQQALDVYGYLPWRSLFGGDQRNLIFQFGLTAGSSHPVMRDSTGVSQPSLLPAMWDFSGKLQVRSMGTRIFCTDCHNSDDNREFGGNGANGPHGSVNVHILERRYDISQVAGEPGSPIVTNVTKNPVVDPGIDGPYRMCAKCHDLNNVLSNVSWAYHKSHVADQGFSCSVCHSAHGVPAGTAGVTGRRLVSFDMNVVAPNNGVVTYSGNTCTLRCHMYDHNADGTVTAAH